MTSRLLPCAALAVGLLLPSALGAAEDGRAQLPSFLTHSYFDVGIGWIDSPFTAAQLEPGFQAESIKVPHAAVRLALLGYRFNEHLALQVNYMRPVQWVGYTNINGVPARRTVWMNVAGFTFRARAPLTDRLSVEGEAGWGVVTRHGFDTVALPVVPIVKDANYWNALFGGGLRYRVNPSWDLRLGVLSAPSNEAARQPHTILVAGGFTYNIRPLSEERVNKTLQSPYVFPRDLLQLGYASDASGFGVNSFVSGGTVPIFWGGNTQVRQGIAAHYHRNVFHTRRLFAFDLGTSVSYWKTRLNNAGFATLSAFPIFRFTPLHFSGAEFYFNYSLAGPTLISKSDIDDHDTGRNFTFQDFMGIGMYAGKDRRVNAEVRIAHYSNGNLFAQNAGVSIPLTFNLGYTFH
jgi:hypothetical protein